MEFTVKDLRRILHEAAGADEGIDLDVSTLDTEFVELGYESIALLETGGRIEREFGIKLDDETMTDSATPRALIDAVNARISEYQRDPSFTPSV
ncbi:acyl carrier protein [Kibdelosporangium aridum]|uniref:acyl carrier protein n=1 Tax=Kibdelosporangium aridum TaxID=2030 RepID=UPI00068F18BC